MDLDSQKKPWENSRSIYLSESELQLQSGIRFPSSFGCKKREMELRERDGNWESGDLQRVGSE